MYYCMYYIRRSKIPPPHFTQSRFIPQEKNLPFKLIDESPVTVVPWILLNYISYTYKFRSILVLQYWYHKAFVRYCIVHGMRVVQSCILPFWWSVHVHHSTWLKKRDHENYMQWRVVAAAADDEVPFVSDCCLSLHCTFGFYFYTTLFFPEGIATWLNKYLPFHSERNISYFCWIIVYDCQAM